MNPLTILAKLAVLISAEPLLQRLLLASLEAAVLATVVALLIRLVRLRSARVICLLWMIVLLKPVVSLTLGSLVPVVHLQAAIGTTSEPPDMAGGIAATSPAGAEHSYGPYGGIVGPEADLAAAGIVQQAPALVSETPGEPVFAEISPGQMLTFAWLAGVILTLGYHLWLRLRLRSVIRRSRPASEPVADRYRALRSQMGLALTPRLLITEALESPAIVGTLRPTVLLPAWLIADGEGDKLDWSIRHELTHYRWLDPWGVLVRDIALILFWFHPAVWWAGQRLVEAMELACDRAMLQGPADAADYAEQLFRMLQNLRQRRRPAIGGGLFATRTQVGRRIAALLETPFKRKPQLTWLSAAALMIVAAAVLAFGGTVGGPQTGPASQAVNEGERVLDFPSDRSLGAISLHDVNREWTVIGDFVSEMPNLPDDALPYAYACEAKGPVRVPAGQRVWLSVRPAVANNLAALGKLRPDDVWYLEFQAPRPQDGQVVVDAALAQLAPLTGLKGLGLQWVKVSSIGCQHISRMKSLEHLSLGADVTNADLARIAQLPLLKTLRVYDSRLTSDGLAPLAKCTSLEELVVGGKDLDDRALLHIGRLPRLRHLVLTRGSFSDAGLAHLQSARSLKSLCLNGLPITDAGLAHLAKLDNLECLELASTKVTDDGLVHLKSLRSLKKLDLQMQRDPMRRPITDAAARHLKEIRTLECLSYDALTDAGLADLAELPNLKYLRAGGILGQGSMFTNEGLRHLGRMRNLENLAIAASGFTSEGIASLTRLLRLRSLNIMMPMADQETLRMLGSIKSLESLSLHTDDPIGISALNRLNGMPNLAWLDVTHIKQDGEVLNLADLPRLRYLMVSPARDSTIRDEDLAWLARLSDLRWLQTRGSIGDAVMAHLAPMRSMDRLVIYGSGITDRGLQYLANMNRLNALTITGDFTDQGLRHLEGLTNVMLVRIDSGGDLSPAAVERLRKKLPNLYMLTVNQIDR